MTAKRGCIGRWREGERERGAGGQTSVPADKKSLENGKTIV